METILKYYSSLSEQQRHQMSCLYDLYNAWNEKINVISRKDINNLYIHHVLHSLSISEVIKFAPGTEVLDVGCGGGFPSIPLAIMFPNVNFHLVDSIGKKLKVCDDISERIGLRNIRTTHIRVENISNCSYDFVISRAAMSLSNLLKYSSKLIKKGNINSLSNGIIVLKGGDLKHEISQVNQPLQIWDISSFYQEDYFNEKKIIYVKL